MNLNIAGIGAAFQGYQEEQRRQQDDERRANAEQRASQDARFQEEARNRQRRDWARSDKILADDDADRAELMQRAQGTTPPTSSATPASLPAPSGLPQPHNFNAALTQQSEFLRRKLARGTLSVQDYANSVQHLDRIKNEGIHDALALMAQGRYDDAMEKYNSSGQMRGARVLEGREGTTQINGQAVPTRFVTLQNPDGTRSTMDVAKAQYQLLDMNAQLAHLDKARQSDMQRDHHAGTLALGREQLAQNAKDAAASRALQSQHLALSLQQFAVTTPAGMIAAKEKALGRTLTPDEKATLLGVDNMPPATKMQLSSVLREQDQISQAINKAQADGTWQEADKDNKSNPLLVRQAMLRGQMQHLLQGQGSNGANPLGLTPPGKATPAPAPPAAGTTPIAVIKPVGGIPAAAPAISTPPAAPENGVVDVRNDPVLQSLRKAVSQLDAQNPATVEQMKSLGQAINTRIDQLQNNYGSMSKLITQ